MKKEFLIGLIVMFVATLGFVACGSSSSNGHNKIHYQNGKLTSAWVIAANVISINDSIVFDPNENYIIADGAGHITESSFYNSPTGTYHVKADGSFAIMVNGVTYKGIINTPTSGTITSPFSGFVTAITNTAGCQGTDLFLDLTANSITNTVTIDIDNSGAVTQSTYPGEYVVTGGHIFCGGGTLLGAVTTDDTGAYKKSRLEGLCPSPPAAYGDFDTDTNHSGAAVGSFALGIPL